MTGDGPGPGDGPGSDDCNQGRAAGPAKGRYGMILRRRHLLAATLAGPGLAQDALAQDAPWPSRPVRIILAYPPGGSTDVLARALAERLAATIPGATFVVDNRPGGA